MVHHPAPNIVQRNNRHVPRTRPAPANVIGDTGVAPAAVPAAVAVPTAVAVPASLANRVPVQYWKLFWMSVFIFMSGFFYGRITGSPQSIVVNATATGSDIVVSHITDTNAGLSFDFAVIRYALEAGHDMLQELQPRLLAGQYVLFYVPVPCLAYWLAKNLVIRWDNLRSTEVLLYLFGILGCLEWTLKVWERYQDDPVSQLYFPGTFAILGLFPYLLIETLLNLLEIEMD